MPKNIKKVQNHMSELISNIVSYLDYLRNEFYTDYTPCDESKFASFDIEDAIAKGVKYNEVQFLATHNSSQVAATDEYKKLYQTIH